MLLNLFLANTCIFLLTTTWSVYVLFYPMIHVQNVQELNVHMVKAIVVNLMPLF